MTDFVKKTKLSELENKTPDISSLATKTVLTAVENKAPDVSRSVKKTNYNKKNRELEKKNLIIIIKTSILLLQSLIL